MNQLQNKKRIGSEIRRPIKNVTDFSASSHNFDWFKSSMKVLAVVIMTVSLSTSLIMVGGTVSYFNDTEISSSNYMKAGPLSFNVKIGGSTSVVVDMTSGSNTIIPDLAPIEGTNGLQYSVRGSFTGGDSNLCNAINTLATFPFPLDGNLSTFISGTSTTPGSWTLDFTLSDPVAFANKSCILNLTYEGWSPNVPYGVGFKDTRMVSITFTVADIAPVLKAFSLPVSDLVNPPTDETPVSSINVEENTPTPVIVETTSKEVVNEPVAETVVDITPIEQSVAPEVVVGSQ